MKICVITGSRSEYGVLEPLIQALSQDPLFNMSLLVYHSHLSPEFGFTASQIAYPYTPVETLLSSDTSIGTVKSMGVSLISFADALDRIKPNLVIIEGDRSEMLAVAQTAYIMQIPIAHISGGDVTEGSLDDAHRDCITRMAMLHFTDTEQARGRVCEILGFRNAENVYCVGSLSLEGLEKYRPSKERFYRFLVCMHPETRLEDNGFEQFRRLLGALFSLGQKAHPIAFSLPGCDAGWAKFQEAIEEMEKYNANHVDVISSLPRDAFFKNVLCDSDCLIGNSSAGIVESPALGIPSINIGNRQAGRPMASSIIQTEGIEKGIQAAIERLHSREFQDSLQNIQLAYEGGNVSEQIVEKIKQWQGKAH